MSHRIGWIIGGAIVVVVGAIIALRVAFPPTSMPTAAAVACLEQEDVPLGLDVILGSTPSEAGNAADDYQKAVQIYRENAEEIDGALRQGDLPGLSVRTSLEKIDEHAAAAARKPSMLYTTVYALKDMEVRYRYGDDDPARDFHRIGQGLNLLARVHATKKSFAAAEKVYRDAFMVGWHMMAERARPHMVATGMDLQQETLERMAAMYKDAGQADRENAVRQYAQALQKVAENYYTNSQVFRTIKPKAGDILHVVKNGRDRSWRVQGLLLLGLVKFTADKQGDLRETKSVIDEYAGSSDPVLAAAAKAAQRFSSEDVNSFASRY